MIPPDPANHVIPFIVAVPRIPLYHFPPKSPWDHQHVRQLDALTYEVAIENPGNVAEFYLALEGAVPSDAYGIGIYWLMEDGSYEFLQAVTNLCPTQNVVTGWPSNPIVCNQPTTRIGLKIEPQADLLARVAAQSTDYNIVIAEKTALNLVLYLQSFQGFTNEMNRAVEAWLQRFVQKLHKDRYFLMRSG